MNEKLLIPLVAILVAMLFYMALAPVVMIDVEIYKMEDGSYIYCASGTLTDPPAKHISSGAVPEGDESYC
jgi:hypothetical protein